MILMSSMNIDKFCIASRVLVAQKKHAQKCLLLSINNLSCDCNVWRFKVAKVEHWVFDLISSASMQKLAKERKSHN
jgi:hypothetical protein